QVNFDCWVAPFPARSDLPGSGDCRRKFYAASAWLALPAPAVAAAASPAQPLPAIKPVPTLPARGSQPPGPQVATTSSTLPTGADAGSTVVIGAGSAAAGEDAAGSSTADIVDC